MATTIKTDHPFTKAQLDAINKELEKISNTQIKALRGFQAKQNYTEIQLLHSPYVLDVFLSFLDITDAEYPKYFMYKIDANGKVDYEAKKNIDFNSLSERIVFFNELQPIKFQ